MSRCDISERNYEQEICLMNAFRQCFWEGSHSLYVIWCFHQWLVNKWEYCHLLECANNLQYREVLGGCTEMGSSIVQTHRACLFRAPNWEKEWEQVRAAEQWTTKITEQLRLEGATGDHLVQPQAQSGVKHSTLLNTVFQFSFELLQGRWEISPSFWATEVTQLWPLTPKNLLTIQWYFLYFSLCLLSFHWAQLGRAWLCHRLIIPSYQLFLTYQMLQFVNFLTSVKQKNHFPAVPFSVQPWMLLALFAAYCWLLVKLVFTMTPRSFSAAPLCSGQWDTPWKAVIWRWQHEK